MIHVSRSHSQFTRYLVHVPYQIFLLPLQVASLLRILDPMPAGNGTCMVIHVPPKRGLGIFEVQIQVQILEYLIPGLQKLQELDEELQT
jgi:hypothetical protein